MYHYKTQGVCSSQINIDVEDNKIKFVEFIGGCNGNLKGICKLTQGKDIQEVIDTLQGITCGYKDTSCPDQYATALKLIQQEEKKRQ